jgi:hypothetical protein
MRPAAAPALAPARQKGYVGAMNEPIGLLPFVPGGPDFAQSRALFQALGFQELWSSGGYAGLQHGAARFILQDLDDATFAGQLMIKLEVADLDAWWAGVGADELTRRFPRLAIKPPTQFAWGREVHLIDLAGVCWHVGVP